MWATTPTAVHSVMHTQRAAVPLTESSQGLLLLLLIGRQLLLLRPRIAFFRNRLKSVLLMIEVGRGSAQPLSALCSDAG